MPNPMKITSTLFPFYRLFFLRFDPSEKSLQDAEGSCF